MSRTGPLSGLDPKPIRAVFTDLDGTLTLGQRLPSSVIRAMEELQQRKLIVVIVSGRPAGWAETLTRIFPIDAMIFENGAGCYIRKGNTVRRHLFAPQPEGIQSRLRQRFDSVAALWGPLQVSSDQPFRLFDFAIDIGEEVERATQERIEGILAALRSDRNVTAKLSSIHINFWEGSHDKRTAIESLIRENLFPGTTLESSVFVGDSPNDEPLFALFPHSVGVANVGQYLSKLTHTPRYLAEKNEASGFLQLVERLLSTGS